MYSFKKLDTELKMLDNFELSCEISWESNRFLFFNYDNYTITMRSGVGEKPILNVTLNTNITKVS